MTQINRKIMNNAVSIPNAALSMYSDQARMIEQAVSEYERGNTLKRGFSPYAASYLDLVDQKAGNDLGEPLQSLADRVARVFVKVAPTELQNALRKDDADLVFNILRMKDLIGRQLPNGHLPLAYAIRCGSHATVERIVKEFSIDTSIRDRQKLTLLDHAMLTKDPKMIALVLGAAIGKRDIPESALLCSVQPTDLQQMQAEKQRYRFIPVSKLPPLCQAAYLGELRRLNDALAKEGADINAPSGSEGLTPLHFAALGGQTAAIEQLLKRGAKVDSFTADGKSPLHLAAMKGHTGVIKWLLDRPEFDVNVNGTDAQGKTPLHCAIFAENLDVARLLVQKGADPLIATMKTIPFALLLHVSKEGSEQRDPLKLEASTIFNSVAYGSALGLDEAAKAFAEGNPAKKVLHTLGQLADAAPAVWNVPGQWQFREVVGTLGTLIFWGSLYSEFPAVKVLWKARQLHCIGKAAMQGLQTCWENRHLETLRPLRNAGLHIFNTAVAAYGLAGAIWTGDLNCEEPYEWAMPICKQDQYKQKIEKKASEILELNGPNDPNCKSNYKRLAHECHPDKLEQGQCKSKYTFADIGTSYKTLQKYGYCK